MWWRCVLSGALELYALEEKVRRFTLSVPMTDPTAAPPHVTALAFSPGGGYLAAATGSNHLYLFDSAQGTLTAWSQVSVASRSCSRTRRLPELTNLFASSHTGSLPFVAGRRELSSRDSGLSMQLRLVVEGSRGCSVAASRVRVCALSFLRQPGT
jgi:WD40 repeat protein